MPDQPAYAGRPRPPLPVAERLIGRILCLPIHEKMADGDVAYVADSIRAFRHG
jgi:dTDP-4-amino-4,6-dideoxygalactose transaminase